MKTTRQITLETKQADLARFEAAMHRAGLNTPSYLDYSALCDEIREEIRQLCRRF